LLVGSEYGLAALAVLGKETLQSEVSAEYRSSAGAEQASEVDS